MLNFYYKRRLLGDLLSGSSSGEVIRVLDSNVVYASNSAASGTSHSLPLAYWSGVG